MCVSYLALESPLSSLLSDARNVLILYRLRACEPVVGIEHPVHFILSPLGAFRIANSKKDD